MLPQLVNGGQGFHNVADKDLTVVAKQSADFDRTKGLNVATNILQANPDVQAIFAHNDEMALGAIQAAKSAGKTIFIVGFDGTLLMQTKLLKTAHWLQQLLNNQTKWVKSLLIQLKKLSKAKL